MRCLIYLAYVLILSAGASAQVATSPMITQPALTSLFEDYKELHRHPELGKQEFKTSAYVRSRLDKIGYTHFELVKALPTAVIAVLQGGLPGPVICLRSELDARPVDGNETSDVPYPSLVPGKMHSCGHDAHAAILIGVAEVLWQKRAEVRGTIVFLFQPAEETAGGADDIVADGVLARLHISAIFAVHSAPGLPVGSFQVSPGFVMAGSSYFNVEVEGRGSHAASPDQGSDLPTALSRLVADLTNYPARHLDVLSRPCVISVAYLNSGSPDTKNVLPSKGTFGGTIRAFEDIQTSSSPAQQPIRDLLLDHLKRESEALGISIEMNIKAGSPPTSNNQSLYNSLVPGLNKRLQGKLGEMPRGMFSEDFSYYTASIPSLYFSLGIAKDVLGHGAIHSAFFSVHPESLSEGVKFWLALIDTIAESSPSVTTGPSNH